jgi:hypothetical protein
MTRALSWLFGLTAYFGPPIWATFAIEADRKAQLAAHGGHAWVCGTPMISIIFLAAISSSLLALVATGFNVASFRALPKPRSVARSAEVGLLILPVVISTGFIALILLG